MSSADFEYENCRFMPIKLLEKAVDHAETGRFSRLPDGISRCKQNLWKLQERKAARRSRTVGTSYRWASVYNYAIRKAVYSHDWDQLLNLLTASPVWEHKSRGRYHSDEYSDSDVYYKAFIILLTHHPQAKELGLLEEYLHMVQSCRSDNDKKAMMKLLSTLPDKLVSRNSHPFTHNDLLKEKNVKKEKGVPAEDKLSGENTFIEKVE